MGPKVDPVASDTTLPERVDVVVIGGGIAGVSATWALAQKGISVALCEKGEIAGEQSSRNWGWCRKMGRDPREIPLIIESMRLWQGMNEAVGGETGFRVTGIAYLCETEADVARREKWLEYAQPYQLDTKLVSAEEVAALYPQATKRFKAALYTKSDGRAEPQKAGPAIAEAARRAGAHILTNCAVRGLEQQGGRVSGVVTEKGRIACGSVVLAGGSWSRLFCGNLGVALPPLKVRSSVLRTEPLDNGPEVAASGGGFAFRKRLDGGYTIANLNASVTEASGQFSARAAVHALVAVGPGYGEAAAIGTLPGGGAAEAALDDGSGDAVRTDADAGSVSAGKSEQPGAFEAARRVPDV